MLMIYHYGKAHSFSLKFAPQQASTDKHFISVSSNITKQSFNWATNWTVCSHNNKEVYWRCMVVVHTYKLYLLCQQEILRGLKIMMYRYFLQWKLAEKCWIFVLFIGYITNVSHQCHGIWNHWWIQCLFEWLSMLTAKKCKVLWGESSGDMTIQILSLNMLLKVLCFVWYHHPGLASCNLMISKMGNGGSCLSIPNERCIKDRNVWFVVMGHVMSMNSVISQSK